MARRLGITDNGVVRARVIPGVLWAATVGLVFAAVAFDRDAFFPGTGDVWVNIGLAFSYPGAGTLILRYRRRNRVGWLMTGVGLASACELATHAYANRAIVENAAGMPAGPVAAWLSSWIWVLGAMPAIVFLPALFPDGTLRERTARVATGLGAVAIASAAIGLAFAPGGLADFPSVRNPVGVAGADDVFAALSGLAFPVFLVAALVSLTSCVQRYRRGDETLRRQLKWFAISTVVFVGLVFIDGLSVLPPAVNALLVVLAPALTAMAIVIAVLRYGLYEIDTLVNRAAVYTVLTGLLVAVYAAGVSAVGSVIGRFGGSVITTGLVAVGFEPARRRVQQAVDRVLYGDRSAPDRVLQDLADDLALARTPDAALQSVARAFESAVGATGVRLVVASDGESVATYSLGTVDSASTRIPLQHQGREVGELTLAHAARTGARGRQERDVIERLRVQAGLAAGAALLASDLQRSRNQAVVVREEERRRIRRDLHDGLGPRLAGLALGIESAHALAATEPDRARDMLDALTSDAYETIDEVRSLVHDLHPDSLDRLGLLPALRERFATLAPPSGSLELRIDVPGALPPLPAAVEVAVYRIALEALTNVVRHADARRCSFRLRVAETVEVTIEDDGVGYAGGRSSGLGVASMTERAAEVGGTLSIGPGETRGTRIRVSLPARVAS